MVVTSMSQGTVLMSVEEQASSLIMICLKICCLPLRCFCIRSETVADLRKLTMAMESQNF